jgi:hypothetical protein
MMPNVKKTVTMNFKGYRRDDHHQDSELNYPNIFLDEFISQNKLLLGQEL